MLYFGLFCFPKQNNRIYFKHFALHAYLFLCLPVWRPRLKEALTWSSPCPKQEYVQKSEKDMVLYWLSPQSQPHTGKIMGLPYKEAPKETNPCLSLCFTELCSLPHFYFLLNYEIAHKFRKAQKHDFVPTTR